MIDSRSREHQEYFLRVAAQENDLSIKTMLSLTSKIGSPKRVRTFNLPLRETCCSEGEEPPIASSGCRAVCYAHKMARDRPNVPKRAAKNWLIAQRADFVQIMTGAIHHAKIEAFKIHAFGDFFAKSYIQAWTRIVQLCGGVEFWAYTRSWRRSNLIPSLTKLAVRPNMNLILSYDRTTAVPPEIPHTALAWLATADSDVPPMPSLVVFRATEEPKPPLLTRLGGSLVCPHENGRPGGPADCVSCRVCFFKSNKKDITGACSTQEQPPSTSNLIELGIPKAKSQADVEHPRIPASTPKVTSGTDLLAMPEFQSDLDEIARCYQRSRSDQLRIGELAIKWIGDCQYSRLLNADKFADLLKQHTGLERTGRQIRNYIDAFQQHSLHSQNGKHFENLEVSHLARIASSRLGEEERLELAHRANQQNASVSQIKDLALQIHRESLLKNRKLEVSSLTAAVKHMDGLELLKKQSDESAECVIVDSQWAESGQCADLPRPFCPEDPVAHLIDCLEVSAEKLARHGLILLHYTGCSFVNSDLAAAVARHGFKHAGEFIWRKPCGAFQNSDSPLMIGHEKVIILCRRECKPKSCCGAVNSVSPKLAAPTRANSGLIAVHPYQKPVQLYEQLIAVATVNGLIVDVYAGSGSAGVAAVRLGCPYVGAELVPEYVELANHRIALAKGENEEVVDALNFIANGARAEQLATIKTALNKCNLNVVQNWTEGGK